MHDQPQSVGCGFCGFMPPYIACRLAESADADVRRVAYETSRAGEVGRTMRIINPAPLLGRSSTPGLGRSRAVYDMEGEYSPLPGTLRRKEGQAATGQREVDEAFEHTGTTHSFYKRVLHRESLDGVGYPLNSTVNYGHQVADAFWDGERVVFGAGDDKLFLPFTRSLAIVAHELSHGVLNFTSNLEYHGQPGALNESFCDVMGISVEQYAARATVANGNWFMGREAVGPALAGVPGFRSFSGQPAYAGHAELGTDPQPKHMRDFVTTTDDHGGVHFNSGIPNHAFYLAAQAIGGNVWETATRIWYEAFTDVLNKRADFTQAAEATRATARRLFGEVEEAAVLDAWRSVGVDPENRA